MCYFITLGVPDASGEVVEALRQLPGVLALRESRNPFVARAFPPACRLYNVTDAHCSCSLVIASPGKDDAKTLASKEEKYRKLGWSKQKMARALAAASVSLARPSREDPEGKLPDLVSRLVESLGRVWFHVHFYAGDVDTARLRPRMGRAVTVNDFRELTGRYPEDVIVEVRPVRRPTRARRQ